MSTGLLMTNLGTPDAPTAAAVRRYLAEFLWDPRVVELPRPIWWAILHGFILRLRPRRSARAYTKVWTDAGSPLLVIAQRQAEALRQALADRGRLDIQVSLGMRYGRPAIAEAMEELRSAGATRILVLPLYPQYAAATTASTLDAVTAVLRTWRRVPAVRFVADYHSQPGYIRALVASIEEAWRDGQKPGRLLFSFHGLPRRCADQGDPYPSQCRETARLVTEALGLPEDRWALAFQSRVGREEWLMPYTDKLLEEWGRAGVKDVDVICPGFSADCLETLEEVAIANRDLFLGAGGERYRYIPALNDRPEHIQALADLVEVQCQGW